MRPLDLYDLGLRLSESAQTEAEQRTVVNRLYYGLHHEAWGRYFEREDKPQPIRRRGRHTGLRDRFNEGPDPAKGNVARYLGQLIEMRVAADYELAPPFTGLRNVQNTEQLMRISVDVSGKLKSALDTYSPREAPDGLERPEVYSTR